MRDNLTREERKLRRWTRAFIAVWVVSLIIVIAVGVTR